MLQEIFQRLDHLEGLVVAGQTQKPLHFGSAHPDTPMATPILRIDDRVTFSECDLSPDLSSSDLSDPLLDLVIETSIIARQQLVNIPYQSSHREIQALLATLPQTARSLQEQISVRRRSWQSITWSVPKEKAKKWVNCESARPIQRLI